MWAISLIQPWAWAIIHAGKDIENRTWDLPQSFQGKRVMLHASKRVTRDDFEGSADMIEELSGVRVPSYELVPMGALVGAVTFVGSLLPGCGPHPWHAIDQFGWIAHEAKELPEPIPCKGSLGFWRVPDDVAERVRRMRRG
jgi:hypothetical protein